MKNAELQRLAREWGATDVPFSQSSSNEWLDTPQVQGVRRHLDHAAALKSVLLLCGPNGSGKSALVGRWRRGLDSRLFHSVTLTQATLSGSGVLAALVAQMGQSPSFRREGNLQRLERAFRELEQRLLVIVLDDAQNYSHGALEEIRLLLGLNLPEQPAFALVIIGDEYLLGTLQLRNHRALFSRLAWQLSLSPWSAPQTTQYLETALTLWRTV